jgi:hypothetical protein
MEERVVSDPTRVVRTCAAIGEARKKTQEHGGHPGAGYISIWSHDEIVLYSNIEYVSQMKLQVRGLTEAVTSHPSLTMREPGPFTVPPMTEYPACLVTGTDSPAGADSRDNSIDVVTGAVNSGQKGWVKV